MVPRCPPGTYPVEGSGAGRGSGQRVIGLPRVGGLCHFCVSTCAARAVFLLLRRALRALAVWLCCSWGGERRGAWARLVRWSVTVSWTSAITLGGLSTHPLRSPLVGRGLPWLRVRACCPPGCASATDPGREVADQLDAPSAARWGPVPSAASCSRPAGVRMVGMCARSVRGLLDRRR